MKVSEWMRSELNDEKIKIIAQDGNVLVTANPGTGKTLLLAFKYLNLLENGVSPEDILCLTFTVKACRGLENRISEKIRERELGIDPSRLKVYTFHSFALENGEDDEVVSNNLLRYAIYDYIKKNEIFNYSGSYLQDEIVPKFERLMRYLKSYGILPSDIDIESVKSLIEEDGNNSKEEMDRFAENFVDIYGHYENIKSLQGIDYSDMLIHFLRKPNVPQYEYVLVDEMQDVNQIEAKIALKCARNFICVGDKKQAIMGFQGGSVSNLGLFDDSAKFILSENFRSGQQVLDYAKDVFQSRDSTNINELQDLRSATGKTCPKPVVFKIERSELYPSACELAEKLSGETGDDKKIAIIARTNYQIREVAKELKARGIDYSSTFLSGSGDAKKEIITFLKGILSNSPVEMKNAICTPFFPVRIQDAFEICACREEAVLEKCEPLKELRDRVSSLRDLDSLFEKFIIPASVAHGEEYFLAALGMKESCMEAIRCLDAMDYESFIDYITAADFSDQDAHSDRKITLTTVHKAKGLEFDSVIYLPKQTRDRSNYQDHVVGCILNSMDIDPKDELLEESLRINFVALTRAENNLYVFSEDPAEFTSSHADFKRFDSKRSDVRDKAQKAKKAFSLFVAGDHEKAREHLSESNPWLVPFIKKHFEGLRHVSFSGSSDVKPFEYFKRQVLRLREPSEALDLGNEIHSYAETILNGNKPEVKDEFRPYFENLTELLKEIKQETPEVEHVEWSFKLGIRELLGMNTDMNFTGKVDAVFKNGDNYLIVDWKTSKNTNGGATARQQLSAYKKAFSLQFGIDESNIKTAIGYVGLRERINDGTIGSELDRKQPGSTSLGTLSGRVREIVNWKNDPDLFVNELVVDEVEDGFSYRGAKLFQAVREQLMEEQWEE